MKFIRVMAALIALACCIPAPASAQLVAPSYKAGNTTLTATGVFPAGTAPVSYTGGVFDARSYGAVVITCTIAPSVGTIQESPDNNGDFITQSAVLNNATGISTTSTLTTVGTFTLPGRQFVQVSGLIDGTCFISGSN